MSKDLVQENEIGFDGEPFDPYRYTTTVLPEPTRKHAIQPASHPPSRVVQPTGPIGEIRRGVADAHRAALSASVSIQRGILRRAFLPTTAHAVEDFGARAFGAEVFGAQVFGTETVVAAPEGAYKPPARTNVRTIDRNGLATLARGDASSVFGAAYAQDGANSDVRLAASRPLVLTSIMDVDLRGGALGQGHLRARFDGDAGEAAVQAAEVFVLFAGLHLCTVDSTLESARPTVQRAAGPGELEIVVTHVDWVPRPHVVAEVVFDGGHESVSVTVTVTEKSGSAVGPGPGGALDQWTGRVGHGGRALLNEFHMAHLARGDQATALGPEFDHYTGHRATRLPTGGLLLVDRITRFDGTRGVLDQQVSYDSEYDSPADSWYYADSANDSMPHFVYMETSLQAALLMGFYLGPTLTAPNDTLSLRNLGGTATVLRRVDPRGKTITQQSTLLSTTLLPGSSLQTFEYTLSVDGQPFYRGETMFGYFSDDALATQTGLDAGRTKPSWLAEHSASATREVDLAARRSDPAERLCSRETLALLDRMSVVDNGGDYGLGYLYATRRIDPDDWFFARHFHLDPVIPGSLGVETVIQAVQEWIVNSGLDSAMTDPRFDIPENIAFTWKYRGQFLPTDRQCELEVHIKSVDTNLGSVIVTVDASLWKPGLRIYELVDLAVELRDAAVHA